MDVVATVENQGLKRDHALTLLREMLRIRRFEEKCAELYSLGKIRGFLHLYIGEEAVAAGAVASLTPEDAIVTTYREHGHALARRLDALVRRVAPVLRRLRDCQWRAADRRRPGAGRQDAESQSCDCLFLRRRRGRRRRVS